MSRWRTSTFRLLASGQLVSGVGDGLYAVAVIDADNCCCDDTQRQEPLENAGPLAACGCRETLGQIERHHHSNQTATDTLQQPSEEERPIAMRKCDDRNADNKSDPTERHQGPAADPVSQQPSASDLAAHTLCDGHAP